MSPRLRPLPALLAAATLSCASTASQRYVDPAMDFGAVKTVALLPFTNLSKEQAAAERVRDVFATMLLSTGAVFVVPPGEVQQAVSKLGLPSPSAPTAEEVVRLGKALKADAVITATVREYGEVRAGATGGNVISLSAQMMETATGKLIWSASSTKGGVSLGDRLLGASGAPMNQVTEVAVDDLLGKLFR